MQMNKAARLELDIDRKTVAVLGEGSLFKNLQQALSKGFQAVNSGCTQPVQGRASRRASNLPEAGLAST